MEIQWSLVLFTVLAGSGAWLFAFMGAAEMRGIVHAAKTRMAVCVLSLALLVAGGLASVTHLSHPDRIMGVLGHPTAGIFAEAAFIGVLAVLIVVFIVMAKRETSAGVLKGVLAVTSVVAVVFSFMLGYSYMMGSQPEWNTIVLPLAYLGTASAVGGALYALLACVCKEDDPAVRFGAMAMIVGGALSAVTSLAYGMLSGMATGREAIPFWMAVFLCGGIAPAVCGFAARSKPSRVLTMAVVAAILAVVGCVALRCLMWMSASGINLFGMSI